MNSLPIAGTVSHPTLVANPPPGPEAAAALAAEPRAPADASAVDTIYRPSPRNLCIRTMRIEYDPAIIGRTPLERFPCATPADTLPIAAAIYSHLDVDQEHFVLLIGDATGCAFAYKVIASGECNQVYVDPLLIFRSAYLFGARFLQLLHNHPSGELTPSPADLTLTRRLVTHGSILGIPITDHIIYTRRTAEPNPLGACIHLRAFYPAFWSSTPIHC